MLQMEFFEDCYSNHSYMRFTDLGWKVLEGEHHVSLAYREDDKATRPQKAVRNRKGAITQPEISFLRCMPNVSSSRKTRKGVEDKGLFVSQKAARTLPTNRVILHISYSATRAFCRLARMKPTTKECMSLISGIGEFKLNKYGDTFIKAIGKYTGL